MDEVPQGADEASAEADTAWMILVQGHLYRTAVQGTLRCTPQVEPYEAAAANLVQYEVLSLPVPHKHIVALHDSGTIAAR